MNKKKTIFSRRSFLLGAGAGLPLAAVSMSAAHGNAPHFPPVKEVPDLAVIKGLLAKKEPNVWLFTGDSITHGAKHTEGYRSYPEIFEERMRWELARTRDWVINTGISSQTTRMILDDFDWRIAKFNPSVVSIMIGTNDCAKADLPVPVYEQNLKTFVDKVRALGAVPVLHTPNPIILRLSDERKTLPEYIPAIRRVAEGLQTILVDNYAYWEDRQKRYFNDVYRQWLNDRLHPNFRGHQQIARLMFRVLGIFDPEHPTCNGEYYEGEH
ncbi:hypothetical protein GCM10023091_34730 [Ravibacter arvi]|uniref:SGNH hydrolase-type esterase domain-containing protein n=1 Tax=Ravibacter arvi TaxID=2051041 RepID=A0ABP8M527_9BACT